MASKTAKQPKVKLTITPGLVNPHMRRAWITFWKRLIAEAKSEAKHG